MSKEAFDIFTFFLFGCINNSCLLNRIASSSLSYTVNVAPSSPSPFPVMESVMFGLVLGHELPPVVIGTTASQSGRRQLFRILQAMAHLTCHTAHICCLWPAAGPAGCSASFATCPVSVRGALVSLPAGENSCLMMFKEAESFPSHVRLWGRKQCLAHVSSVPSCTSCSSLLLHELRFLGGEDIQSFGCEWWWNQCLAGALCWEVWQGVSVCLLILPWGLLSFSSTPQLLAALPLSPHVPLAAALPKMPPCQPLPGVVLQGCSLCLRGDGHEFCSFQVMLLVTIIAWSLKCAVGWVQAASCKDPLSNRHR